jgi:hypothetical protein
MPQEEKEEGGQRRSTCVRTQTTSHTDEGDAHQVEREREIERERERERER